MGVDGNDYNNRFQSILRQRKNIDARVSADTNALFSEENYSIFLKEVKANTKAAQKAATRAAWISALPSIFSAVGTGAAAIANASARRRATTSPSTTSTSQATPVATYAKMESAALQAKQQEYQAKVADYMQKESDAKTEKETANANKITAKTDYDKANDDYNTAKKDKATADGTVTTMQNNYNNAVSRQGALAAKQPYDANATDTSNMRTADEETELTKLNASAETDGSVLFYQKKQQEAQAESDRLAGVMEQKKNERDEQARLIVQYESEASTKQKDEANYKNLKEQAQAELNNINAAIAQQTAQSSNGQSSENK